MRVACILLEQPDFVQKFAESCIRFSPVVATGNHCVFIEIGKCSNLYTEEWFKKRVQVLLSRFQLKGFCGIADDIPTARAFAYYRVLQKEKLPIDALSIFANAYEPDSSLQNIVLNLKNLGIHTFADFSRIPRAELAARFGKTALYASHTIDHAQDVLWRKFKPAEIVIERKDIDSDQCVSELEPLLFYFKTLIDQALLRLRGQGKLVSILKVTLHQEKYSTIAQPKREWTIDFAFPQGSVLSVLPILKERLDSTLRRDPLQSPVTRLECEIIRAIDGNLKQSDFFSKRELEEEQFRVIVARLTDRLGLDKVFLAVPLESYLPERSWKKTLEEPGPDKEENCAKSANMQDRPLRVLKSPARLRRIENIFIHRKKRWKAQEILGPERLSGEWWFHDKERDYYRVKTENEELWIYMDPESKDYFLHGIFD